MRSARFLLPAALERLPLHGAPSTKPAPPSPGGDHCHTTHGQGIQEIERGSIDEPSCYTNCHASTINQAEYQALAFFALTLGGNGALQGVVVPALPAIVGIHRHSVPAASLTGLEVWAIGRRRVFLNLIVEVTTRNLVAFSANLLGHLGLLLTRPHRLPPRPRSPWFWKLWPATWLPLPEML